jgi:hypothetical protein
LIAGIVTRGEEQFGYWTMWKTRKRFMKSSANRELRDNEWWQSFSNRCEHTLTKEISTLYVVVQITICLQRGQAEPTRQDECDPLTRLAPCSHRTQDLASARQWQLSLIAYKGHN